MSLVAYELRLQESYTSGVTPANFDLDAWLAVLRLRLRALRESRKVGRDKFGEDIGINRTTIQNLETGPDVPKIDTVVRFIVGCGLTPAEFFNQMESSDGSGHSEKINVRLRTEAKGEHNTSPSQSVGVPDAVAAAVRESSEATLDRIRYALREAGTILFGAGVQAVAGTGESDSEIDLGSSEEIAEHDRLHPASTRKTRQG